MWLPVIYLRPKIRLYVQVLDSNSLRVHLTNPSAWWWKNGAGCESYETETCETAIGYLHAIIYGYLSD
jgi:hypothetical protein